VLRSALCTLVYPFVLALLSDWGAVLQQSRQSTFLQALSSSSGLLGSHLCLADWIPHLVWELQRCAIVHAAALRGLGWLQSTGTDPVVCRKWHGLDLDAFKLFGANLHHGMVGSSP
jgi:hypothetical protein